MDNVDLVRRGPITMVSSCGGTMAEEMCRSWYCTSQDCDMDMLRQLAAEMNDSS